MKRLYNLAALKKSWPTVLTLHMQHLRIYPSKFTFTNRVHTV